MGTYLFWFGIAAVCIYNVCNRFVWKIPTKFAIPINLICIAAILVGAVWGLPMKEALFRLAICIAISLLGAFLAWKFLK